MAGSARSAAAKHAYRMFAPSRSGGGATRGPGGGAAEEFDESDVVWGSAAADSHSSSPVTDATTGWARPIPGSSSSSSRAGRNKKKQPTVDGGGGAAGSLPMNIPDWQKILGVEYRDHHYAGEWEPDADEGGGGGTAEMVPPHELAWRGRAASMSVHEGIGRTLKGRDLSRVRDAVWKKTGFED